MPETRKTRLPIPLALTVAKILRDKHNIDHWKDHSFDDSFTTEELSKITELSFDDNRGEQGCCTGIELLPNLKKLSISSRRNTAYVSPDDIVSIGYNKDVTSIEKCKSLETLTIENQDRLSYLDVSQLTNLRKLEVVGNQNLEHLDGLDKVPLLNSLTCFGNESLFKIEKLDKIIEEKPHLQHLNLDVLLFPSAVGYRYSGQTNEKAIGKIKRIASNGRCSWTQAVIGSKKTVDSFGRTITRGTTYHCRLSNPQMIEMHNCACQILENNVQHASSTLRTVVGVENYLARNVVYDREHAKEKEGITHGDNGAYNCLVKKYCVCEGYTRGMQYLLALKGIQSHTVSCISGKPDEKGMADLTTKLNRFTLVQPDIGRLHSILRVDDCYCYYCDPCWDAGKYQLTGAKKDQTLPYCLLTKSEISNTHTLSHQERVVSEGQKKSRTEITDEIKYNELFLKTKTAQMEEQRKQLGQQKPARGMILTGRS